MTEPKKRLILATLEVLKKHTDEEHPLKQVRIQDLISEEYGLSIDRKSLRRNGGDAGFISRLQLWLLRRWGLPSGWPAFSALRKKNRMRRGRKQQNRPGRRKRRR